MPVYSILLVNRSNTLFYDQCFTDDTSVINGELRYPLSSLALTMGSTLASTFTGRVQEISPDAERETGFTLIEGHDYSIHAFRTPTRNTILAVTDPGTTDLKYLFLEIQQLLVDHVVMDPLYATDASGAPQPVSASKFPLFAEGVRAAVMRVNAGGGAR
jgi:hypothetical protein